jgi:hypothetical protein
MGYSICISPKSPKARSVMMSFLEREFRDLGLDIGEPVRDGDMGYDDGKCRIGFNYSASADEVHYYMWAMLGWMAQKVGRVKSFHNTSSGLDISATYIKYDGHECYPVVGDRPRGVEAWQVWPVGDPLYVCDALGLSKENASEDRKRLALERAADAGMKAFLKGELDRLGEVKAAIGAEMARLDAMWSGRSSSAVSSESGEILA